MVLTAAPIGKNFQIAKVNGKDEVRSHLAALGFVEGADVSVVNELSGNVIIHVKDTRIALDKSLSNRIHVTEEGNEHDIKGSKTWKQCHDPQTKFYRAG